MKFLIDANVLSEPTRSKPDSQVVEWLRQNQRDSVISSIILGELHYGIMLLPNGARKSQLEQWFSKGIGCISCLPWDSETALEWAQLLARLKHSGQPMPIKDSMMAATALQYGLIVVTRNISDFKNTRLSIYNPFRGP